jgi:hypothetical protein
VGGNSDGGYTIACLLEDGAITLIARAKLTLLSVYHQQEQRNHDSIYYY